jgi:hypothetical protein
MRLPCSLQQCQLRLHRVNGDAGGPRQHIQRHRLVGDGGEQPRLFVGQVGGADRRRLGILSRIIGKQRGLPQCLARLAQ